MLAWHEMTLLLIFFQDLQIEIDTERENYLNLTATGRKILSQLEGQEDASIIQKRLEEMNQRWNYLKAKSIAIRYLRLLPKECFAIHIISPRILY